MLFSSGMGTSSLIYAVFGFAFLFFYKMKGRNLILLGSVCYVLPFAILGSLFLIMGIFEGDAMAIPTDSEMMKQSLEVYQSGTFTEIMSQRALDWYMVNNPF